MKHPRMNRNAAVSKPAVARMLRTHPLPRQALWVALTIALGLPGVHAQVAPTAAVHPDGHTSTTLNTTANGVPVVNIAAPNSAGVSHNTYQQFDVGSNGLILNNSGAISTTQLAGYVTGNPQLSPGQSASLILNEVTSTLPSHLNGVIEVAGKAAEVVVANPNGIECTGCGFINAPRSTLTTGTPIFASDGSLSALHVTGGTITIDGQGLDGSQVDRVDLLARAVAVNAGVWANQLNVVTGANQIDYSTLGTQHLSGTGATPAVAIDVSALGGMYAGVIRLVGTDAGLGVNNQGQVAAQNGDLTLTSAGQVMLGGKTTATGTVTVGALQAVSNTGTLAAGGAVNVTSGSGLTSSGTLYSGGAMTLSAAGSITNSGQIKVQSGALAAQTGAAITNASGSSILVNGPITFSAVSLSNSGAIESAQGVGVQVSASLSNSGSLLADSGDLALQASNLSSTGVLSASGNATLTGTAALSSTGQLLAGSAITLSAPSLTTGGTVQAGTTLNLSGTSLINSGKLYALGGDWTAKLGGAFSNIAGGDIYSTGALNLIAASAINAGGIEAKQALNVSSTGDISNSGTVQSDNSNLTVNSGGALTSSGSISAAGNLGLRTVNTLAATGQTIANGNLSLSGGNVATAGTVQAGQALSLTSSGNLSNSGKLYALGGGWTAQIGGAFTSSADGDIYGIGNVTMNAASLSNQGGIEAKQASAITVGGALGNSGTIQSDQSDVTLMAGSLDNAGTISAQHNLQGAIVQAASNSGTLVSGQAIGWSAASFTNTSAGQVQSGTDLALAAGTLSNAGNLHAKGNATVSGGDIDNTTSNAQLLADGALTLDNTGAVSNAGVLQAGSDLTLMHAAKLTNAQAATVYAGHDLNLSLAQALTNSGMLYAAQGVSLSAGSVSNEGVLRSGGNLILSSAGDVTSTNAIQAQQNLTLTNSGAFDNSGKLYAVDGSLSVQTGGNVNSSTSGDIYSGQNITFNAGGFSNAGMLEAKQAVSLTAQAVASNSGTVQADDGDLTVTAAALSNQGTFSATGNVQLSGTSSLANGGQVVTGQALTLAGARVSNSGQTQSGTTTTVQAAALDNSGRLQAGTLLAINGNATLINEATGLMLATGNVGADTSSLLSNAGVIQAGGTLAVDGAGALSNQAGGTLYSAAQTTLQLGGSLTNAGTVYGAQGVSLDASSLSNAGSLRSGASLVTTTQGNASNNGSAYAVGSTIWNVGGTLANAGDLAAGGDNTLNAASVASSGILAAGLQGDGSLGTTGTLTITSTGNLASNGRALAGGSLAFTGSAIDLSGSQTRAGNNATLTATQGGVSNLGGNLASNGTLTIHAPGTLINGGNNAAQGGQISAATLALQVAGINNRYGTIRQSGSSDLNLALSGAFINAYGTFASNAGNLTISAASIDNTAGAIQHAGSGLLHLTSGGDLTNSGGRIVGNGALGLQAGGALANAGGTIGVANDATVSATSVDNTSGSLSANNITLTVAQALTNTRGTLQASGALNLGAGTLDNTGGIVKVTGTQALGVTTQAALTNGAVGFIGGNGAVNISAGSLVNAGQIYAGSRLGVSSTGGLTNNNGALQALGSLAVSSGGNVSNRAGTLEAGAGNTASTLTLNAASLDNSGGRVANAAQGDTTIAVANGLVNQGGTLGGQGNVTLSAATLDNSQNGHLVGGQNLGLLLGGMNNAGGTVYAANNLYWNNTAASLANAQGNLGAGGNLAFTLAAMDNSAGAVAATSDVALNLGGFTGTGRVAAGQDLALTLAGNYTNGQGNQLVANRDLSLNVSGNFSNPAGATLQAVRNLTVSAANIDNAANATVNSAGTTLTTAGTLSNEGSIEGDTIALNANTLNNTSTIIGGAITATAGNLTNGADLGSATTNNAYQSALIAATASINLYVSGTLLNRDASIFTTGNLTIAADAALDPSAAITNLSGDIEASGNATLAANQFTNQRRVVTTSAYTLNSSERASNTSTTTSTFDWTTDPNAVTWCAAYGQTSSNGHALRCGPMGYYGDSGHDTLVEQVQAVNRLASASAQSQLLAGGNITLNGSVLNNASTIAAGNNLIINSQNGSNGGGSTSNATVQNIAWSPTATVLSTDTRAVDGDYQGSRWYSNRENGGAPIVYWTGTSTSTIALDPSGNNGWITINPGAGLAATMSAGNTVDITAHTISNTVVGADGQPVHAVIGLGANGGGQSINGSGAGTVGSVNGASGNVAGVALGNAPAATTGGSLGLAQNRGTLDTGATPAASTTGSRAIAGGNTASGGALAAPQVVSTLVGPQATISLPQSGLYTVNTSPSSPYLVETNPRFTQYNNFISSDYLLGQLSYNPASTQKRLGDGFYEEQQVLDQITNLTGRRYLSDETDALDQYRDLMNNGVSASKAFNLSVGVALTPAQMASLTQDIVWLVSVTVDGQQVLEPVVYLSAADAKAMAASGATIAGKNVVLTASGDITNNGTIAASQSAQLTAANLLNSGSITAGSNLSINAAQNILNGGTLSAGGNVSLVAGNDVLSGVSVAQSLGAVNLTGLNAPVTTVALTAIQPGSITAGGNLAISAGRDLSLDTAPVAAGGNLSLAAGRDLSLTATAVSAGGDAQLLAGRDLSLNATSHVGGTSDAAQSTVSTTYTVSTIGAGGTLVVAAGRDIVSQGAQLTAGSQLGVSAGRDITLNAVTDNTFVGSGQESGHHFATQTQSDDTLRGTTLSGANGVAVSAGRDITTTAGTIAAANGAVTLDAGRDVTLFAGVENHTTSSDTYTHSGGHTYGSKTVTTHDDASNSLAVGTTISSQDGIAVDAGRNVLAVGATLKSSVGGIAITAGDQLSLLASSDTHTTDHSDQTRESGFEFVPNPHQGTRKENTTTEQVTANGSTLDAGGSILLVSGGNQTYQAANVHSGGDTALVSGGTIDFLTATNVDEQSRTSSKHNVAWQATDESGHVNTTEQQSTFTGGGGLSVASANGVEVQYGQRTDETQMQAIARLTSTPGTDWINALQGNPDVTWQGIAEQQQSWHQHHEGMTPALGAVVTVVAAYFTAGAASAAIGGASGAAAGSGTAFAAAGTSATGAAVSAGWANATIAGAVAGSASGAAGAIAQGNDWRTPALYGGITGGLTGYLSAGTYYNNPINSAKQVVGDIANGNVSALGKFAEEYAATTGAGKAEAKLANDLGLNGNQLNWLLMAGSIAGNEWGSVGSRYATPSQETPDGNPSFDTTNNTGIAGILNRNNKILGAPFDAIDILLGYQGLPDASGADALYNKVNGVNQAPAPDLTCHSLGTITCSYLGWNGTQKMTLAAVPFGVVAPPNASVIIGNGDAVNGFYGGLIFNWNATVAPISFIVGHPFVNYKPYVDGNGNGNGKQ